MLECGCGRSTNNRQGLGYEVAKRFVQQGYDTYGTARSGPPKDAAKDIHWISGVDVAESSAGNAVVDGLKGTKPDIIIITAGLFPKEEFDKPDFDAEVNTYKVVAM